MRLLFVMNPTSGKTGSDDVVQLIRDHTASNGFEHQIYFTTGEDDDEAIRKSIKAYMPDRVAACGGDGTVQLVARNMINTDVPLGILPLGSANGLATAMNIPRDPAEALSVITLSPNAVPFDLLLINNKHICTHLCDIGTNALLVKSYEESGDKGLWGYAKHLISSIQQSDTLQFQIHTSSGNFYKEGFMLVIANAHKYGTGVQISEGSVSDGRFEICNVQRIDLESAIKAGLTAINVFIDKEMFTDVITCEEAFIKITPAAHLQVDGEYMGEVSELKVNILSGPLKIIV